MLNTKKQTTLFSLDFLSGIKPVFFIFLIFFQVIYLEAQENLVPNGSFEEYWDCPISNNLNNGQFEKAKGWWSPTSCTPDYFNRCNNGIVGIPNNFWGFQEAYHGDAYVGIVPISFDVNNHNPENEYIRTELLYPLKPCYEYKFSMFVALSNYSTHSIGNLGVVLSKENQFYNSCAHISYNLNTVFEYTSDQINDTLNWMKIEGTFIASGEEKYITIGYFFNTLNEDTIFIQDFGVGIYSYLFIDKIELIESNSIKNSSCIEVIDSFPNVFTPNNDGSNDFIDISEYLHITNEVIVVNRWGNIVIILDSDNQIWDGENFPDGVYYFYFDYFIGNLKKRKTGFIHLIR